MSDLKKPFLIHLKGWLFFAILCVCSGLLIFENPTIRFVVFLGLIIWSAARFYYYLFYVIEKYVDPDYRFSGLYSALKYLLSKKRN